MNMELQEYYLPGVEFDASLVAAHLDNCLLRWP